VKAQASGLLEGLAGPNEKLNILREYLQAFVLRSLHESQAFRSLSFVGGTSLRFLYDLSRFSEDLDFSLEDDQNYEPKKWLAKLGRDLGYAGFDAKISWSDRKTVNVGWVKVAGILHEAGLAATANQNLSTKLEIDTKPPRGAIMVSEVVNRHFLIALRHHDLPSLMAGKIHALCTRRYLKGRDWYDLLWYRTQSPPVTPNLSLLQSALDQTDQQRSWPAGEWKNRVLRRLRMLDERAMQKEVAPLLERAQDRELLTAEFITAALRRESR
jgi:predicted nucleotidyltransferase component of viral defense system